MYRYCRIFSREFDLQTDLHRCRLIYKDVKTVDIVDIVETLQSNGWIVDSSFM